MNKLLKFLSASLLCWFITISISLIIGILFLTESMRGGVPTVLVNLWIITLFTLPVYAILSFYPRKIIGCAGAVLVLVILSFSLNNTSEILPFPKLQSIVFIGAVEQDEELEQSIEIEEELKMELPDEL
ncbi:MAG: hypothetical protein ACI9E1_000106 [Cryomorphaceae bacterium]|jgi:hypothetical protein